MNTEQASKNIFAYIRIVLFHIWYTATFLIEAPYMAENKLKWLIFPLKSAIR